MWLGVGLISFAQAQESIDTQAGSAATKPTAGSRLNVLLITADDLNYDATGVTGCKIPGITPAIDKLAADGMRFVHAHVTVSVCQPSRSVLMTGRYPYHNGAMGFEPIRRDVPTLGESLRAAGYVNGIFAKVPHLAPQDKFCWDTVVGADELGQGRDPVLYYQQSKVFFEKAKTAGKPFFLMANSQDPHRPFAGGEPPPARNRPKAARRAANAAVEASKRYDPREVPVPGFLPDLPPVRKELAQYFASVHRCDETVGEILRALKETGLESNTLVVFLGDNGMPFPFAKTNCYLTSTRTAWIVRWPGRIRPGTVDSEHMISGIDFMPTVLAAAGLPQVDGMDGRSFLPLLTGSREEGRDKVYTVFHETSGKRVYPMRSVQDKRFGYIFNAWSDGKTVFQNEAAGSPTCKTMEAAAKDDPKIAERVKLFRYRVPEELFDYEKDPAALNNLIDNPSFKEARDRLRAEMLKTMEATRDPLVEAFKKRLQTSAGQGGAAVP